jgi:hypothetical protein
LNVFPIERLSLAAQDQVVQRPHPAEETQDALKAMRVGVCYFVGCSPQLGGPFVVQAFQMILKRSRGVEQSLDIRVQLHQSGLANQFPLSTRCGHQHRASWLRDGRFVVSHRPRN